MGKRLRKGARRSRKGTQREKKVEAQACHVKCDACPVKFEVRKYFGGGPLPCEILLRSNPENSGLFHRVKVRSNARMEDECTNAKKSVSINYFAEVMEITRLPKGFPASCS